MEWSIHLEARSANKGQTLDMLEAEDLVEVKVDLADLVVRMAARVARKVAKVVFADRVEAVVAAAEAQ